MCLFYLQYLTESDLEPLRLAIDRLEDDPDFIPDTLPQVIQKDNFKNIRIHHECEGGWDRKKNVPRINVWHHEACRVMTNGVSEGQIFLSKHHTNNGFFFFSPIISALYVKEIALRSS